MRERNVKRLRHCSNMESCMRPSVVCVKVGHMKAHILFSWKKKRGQRNGKQHIHWTKSKSNTVVIEHNYRWQMAFSFHRSQQNATQRKYYWTLYLHWNGSKRLIWNEQVTFKQHGTDKKAHHDMNRTDIHKDMLTVRKEKNRRNIQTEDCFFKCSLHFKS